MLLISKIAELLQGRWGWTITGEIGVNCYREDGGELLQGRWGWTITGEMGVKCNRGDNWRRISGVRGGGRTLMRRFIPEISRRISPHRADKLDPKHNFFCKMHFFFLLNCVSGCKRWHNLTKLIILRSIFLIITPAFYKL